MTGKLSNEAPPDKILYCVKGYIYLTATVCGLVGVFLLSTSWATRNNDDWWLGWRDPLLGLNNRAMLILGGILHIGMSVYLFVARDATSRTLAAFGLGLNHVIYFTGVLLLEPTALPNTERFLGWRLGIQPMAVDARWKILQLYLIIASGVFLFLIWRRTRRFGNVAWLKHWQETRNLTAEAKTVTTKKAEAARDYTKNVCSSCGGKIAFPLSRVGENIACPHCASMITLREPPASMT